MILRIVGLKNLNSINFACQNIYNLKSQMVEDGTVAQIYKEELMDFCACKKGAKAVYYCKFKDCPDNRARSTYCIHCSEN
jgi:hypothetical protein